MPLKAKRRYNLLKKTCGIKKCQVKSRQFYMYSAKSQQKLSPDTFNIEQVKTCTELC